jgi:hypothetical protein
MTQAVYPLTGEPEHDTWIIIRAHKTYELPGTGITVTVLPDGSGKLATRIEQSMEIGDEAFNAAVNAVESLVLAHACAGVPVDSEDYVTGVKTTLEAISNNT